MISHGKMLWLYHYIYIVTIIIITIIIIFKLIYIYTHVMHIPIVSWVRSYDWAGDTLSSKLLD